MRPVLVPARAKAEGQLRADFVDTDIPIIHTMLAAVIERTQTLSPDLWRRYFVMIVDGVQSRRETTTPIETPPLAPTEVALAISTPRPR